MKAPVFNMGNPARKQCAMRDDGVWFVRTRRLDAPGFTKWRLAPFNTRPLSAWYAGAHARLPDGKGNDRTTDAASEA